jgi:pimeloyl-[acyl-carrier protein] methyl ester esterase
MSIHSEIYGQGRTLVMIHGWGMHSGVWREFAKQLSKSFQVICIDLPGHGGSDAISPFDLERIAVTLIQAIPAKRFSLLGWSLGGTIAIAMADRFPERVDALIVLAGNPQFVKSMDWLGVEEEIFDAFSVQLQNDVQKTQLQFLALQTRHLADGKRLFQQLKKTLLEYAPPSLEIMQAGLAILKQSNLRQTLTNLRCPVHIIQGNKDNLIPLGNSFALQSLNPLIKLHILEDAGHVPFLSHPDQLFEIIDTVL